MSSSTTDYLKSIFDFVPSFHGFQPQVDSLSSKFLGWITLPRCVKQHSRLPRGVFSADKPDPPSLEYRSANVANEVDSGYGRKTSHFFWSFGLNQNRLSMNEMSPKKTSLHGFKASHGENFFFLTFSRYQKHFLNKILKRVNLSFSFLRGQKLLVFVCLNYKIYIFKHPISYTYCTLFFD